MKELPLYRIIRFTDREVAVLLDPWWKRLIWTSAQWNCYRRARSKIRDGFDNQPRDAITGSDTTR